MLANNHISVNPLQHILDIFEKTKDNRVSIIYYPDLEEPYDLAYEISWTKKDAEELVRKYVALTDALTAIAGIPQEYLECEEKRKNMLSAEELSVWETYIRNFDEKFDVDEAYLSELYQRRDCDCLEEDEFEILERHYEWFDMQCRKRLPFEARSPMIVINRAQRYEYSVRNKMSQKVINDEGRRLAEEMILYYFSKDFALEKTTIEELFALIDEEE